MEAKLGGLLFDANDTWFCPTDLAQAPDGSVYVCDFHDKRTAHPDPDAAWDLSNGRIYRLEAEGTKIEPPFDLGKASSAELVRMLGRRNRWYADQARVILAARRDRSTWPALRAMAAGTGDPQRALQGLWGLSVSGGLDDRTAAALLAHPSEHVRAWTVRLLGDRRRSLPAMIALARTDPSPVVRAQLAASARRLGAGETLAILAGLEDQNRDRDDPFIPWLIWWALEEKAVPAMDAVTRAFAAPESWSLRSRHDDQRRLIRRYASEGKSGAYEAASKLLAAAPAAERASMLAALEQGLAERAGEPVPADTGVFQRYQAVSETVTRKELRSFEPVIGSLRRAIEAEWSAAPASPAAAKLAIRAGLDGAVARAAQTATSKATPEADRVGLLEALAETADASTIVTLLPLLEEGAKVRDATMGVLGRFDDPRVTAALLRHHDAAPGLVQDLLLSRPASARALIESGKPVAMDKLKRAAYFKDPALDALVRRKFGAVKEGTPEEMLATVRRLNNDLRAGSGDLATGKRLYFQHCGSCHKLNGEGGALGMDLTGANRADRYYLLTHIADPSAFIRKEYMTYRVTARDGRVATGLMAEEDGAAVTLIDAAYRKTRLERSAIASIEESPVSVMPEGLLEKLAPQALRDLFAYLQK